MKIPNLFLFGLLVAIVSCQMLKKGSKSTSGSFTSYSTTVDNERRSYWVYTPSVGKSGDIEPESFPVLFMFHGSRSSGKAFAKGTGFNKIAEREKLVVVYPDALVGNWAEACGCNNADRLKVKDVEFVEKITEEVSEKHEVDSSNIFAAGFSQGGLFVDRLACEMSDRLKGAAVIGAAMSVPLSKSCSPRAPIPMMFIQGTNDAVLPYKGVSNGPLSLLSAKEAANFWAEKNGVKSKPAMNGQADSGRRKVKILRYSADGVNAEVTLFSVTGFGHGWPKLDYFNTNEKIAEFVSKHRKKR